ncbi:winged helix DNA-binding protein, partial [Streptomyces sp900129855]
NFARARFTSCASTPSTCPQTGLTGRRNGVLLVTRLTDAGLLERHQDDTDKRVAHLRVTAKARQRIRQAEDVAARQLVAALRTLTDGDRDALGSALGALEALTRRLRDHSAA